MVFRDCTARHGGGLDAQVFVGERRVLITMKTGGFVLDNVTYGRSSKKKNAVSSQFQEMGDFGEI